MLGNIIINRIVFDRDVKEDLEEFLFDEEEEEEESDDDEEEEEEEEEEENEENDDEEQEDDDKDTNELKIENIQLQE